jgi:hypothetical protein
MTKLIIENNDTYLSYAFVQTFGISYNTIKHWSERKIAEIKYFEGKAFVRYKDIPAPTRRKKLPDEGSLIREFNKKQINSKVKDLLHQAFYYKFAAFRSIYENESSFTSEQVTRFARLHSVFQAILDLKKSESFHKLAVLLYAFNELFPAKYTTTQSFSQAILRAAVNGPMSVALDKRTFGNNSSDKKSTTPQIDFLMATLTACNCKFTNKEIFEKANEYFRANGIKEYKSVSVIKKHRAKWLKNPEVYKARYGQTEAQKQLPYASLQNASYVHVQWQIDGFTLPFWEDKFHRSTVVFIIDNCSKKIVGYAVGNSENSELIKAALRNAINNTGVLPFELVMDNHAFTQTQAAFNMENHFKKYGAIVTKTSNPRQKVIVERYIQNLNNLFKSYFGYLGQSIKSKSIEAIASDELRTEYAKKFRSHNEVIAITTSVIEQYNNTPQKGKTPIEKYSENSHPSPIVPNQFDRAQLLPFKISKKIDRGQINIMRGTEKFEYQLPAHLFQIWNNKTVIVTHDNLQDGIYLFDKENENGIAFLMLKQKMHNSKAEQTENDIQGLNNNKGRLNGIQVKGRKQLEEIRDKAHNIDPEAYLKVSALTTPKSIIKELEQNANLRHLVEDQGVITNEMNRTVESFDITMSLKPSTKKTNPFTVKNNKLEIFDPTKLIEDDE